MRTIYLLYVNEYLETKFLSVLSFMIDLTLDCEKLLKWKYLSRKVYKQPYDYNAYIAHGSNPILLFNSNLRKYDNPETNLWKLLLFASTRTQDFVMIKWRNLNDLGEK